MNIHLSPRYAQTLQYHLGSFLQIYLFILILKAVLKFCIKVNSELSVLFKIFPIAELA